MSAPSRYLCACLLSLLAAMESIDAQSPATPQVANSGPAVLSLDQAVKMVEQQFHARVVKAETQTANGRTIYSLRLLNESGKVWTVRVDAASGAQM